jgi:nicotinamidase-related amidase
MSLRDQAQVTRRRALLLVDVIKDFRHEDGDALLDWYRRRHAALLSLLDEARAAGTPVIYANDDDGRWDSNAHRLVREAVEYGKAGDLVAAVAPAEDDSVILKPAYSAFEDTPLAGVLRERGVDELVLAGTATEMCAFETAAEATRAGFSVLVRADASATVDETNERPALDYLERVLGLEVVRASE